MQNLIQISMDDNTKLYIEVIDRYDLDGVDPLMTPANSDEKVIKKAKCYLESSLAQIKHFSNSISDAIKNSNPQPDELELEFAVKFAADAGIVISSIGAEANVNIKMKWKKDKGE